VGEDSSRRIKLYSSTPGFSEKLARLSVAELQSVVAKL